MRFILPVSTQGKWGPFLRSFTPSMQLRRAADDGTGGQRDVVVTGDGRANCRIGGRGGRVGSDGRKRNERETSSAWQDVISSGALPSRGTCQTCHRADVRAIDAVQPATHQMERREDPEKDESEAQR